MAWDSHCHLDLLEEPEEALRRAREAGITGVLIPGYGPSRWQHQRYLLETHPDVLKGALGVHPWALETGVDYETALSEEMGRRRAAGTAPCAIGEFGLDRTSRAPDVPFELQERVFRLHLQWARRLEVPVILHLVKADGPAQKLLAETPGLSGVVHSFSSHHQMLRVYREFGLSFSYGTGLLKFPKVRESLKRTPHEHILFETDGPEALKDHFSPPHGPHHLPAIVEAAAEILQRSVAWCWELHRENCRRILGLE